MSDRKLLAAITCGLLLASATSSANLIVNADFEAGDSGFSSDLASQTGNIVAPGVYRVLNDPSIAHPSASSYGDHTTGTGLMMAVNGSTNAGDVVWGQTVAVLANATYDFAAHISSWFPGAPAELVFEVNGASIGTLTAPGTTGQWEQFFATWDSSAATTATIEIVNNNIVFGGNDFALDDLYFGDPVLSDPNCCNMPPSNSVPEPSTVALLGLSCLGLALQRRRVLGRRA